MKTIRYDDVWRCIQYRNAGFMRSKVFQEAYAADCNRISNPNYSQLVHDAMKAGIRLGIFSGNDYAISRG